MNKYLVLILVILGILIISGIALWLFRSWKFAKTIARLAPALVELKPFFALLNLLGDSSHAMERHGPMTRVAEQVKRARKGISPDGAIGKPVDSGRWNSHYPMHQAIEYCTMLWTTEKTKAKKSFVVEFDQKIGEVILRDTKEAIQTSRARIVLNKQGHVVTAFPIAEDLARPDNVIYLQLAKEEAND